MLPLWRADPGAALSCYPLGRRRNIMRGVVECTPPWFRAWVASKIRAGLSSLDIRDQLRPLGPAEALVGSFECLHTARSLFPVTATVYTDFDTFLAHADVGDTLWALDAGIDGAWPPYPCAHTAHMHMQEVYACMLEDASVPQCIVEHCVHAADPRREDALGTAITIQKVLVAMRLAEATWAHSDTDDVCIQARWNLDTLDDIEDDRKEQERADVEAANAEVAGRPAGHRYRYRAYPRFAKDDFLIQPGKRETSVVTHKRSRTAPRHVLKASKWRHTLRTVHNPASLRVEQHHAMYRFVRPFVPAT